MLRYHTSQSPRCDSNTGASGYAAARSRQQFENGASTPAAYPATHVPACLGCAKASLMW
jgi:hypothetical protein